MTNKEILIDYLKFKNKLIYNKTGLVYMLVADFKAIENLPDIDIIKIHNELGFVDDDENCPFCIISSFCINCLYGERNIICNGGYSRYNKIIARLDSDLMGTFDRKLKAEWDRLNKGE